MSRGSAALALRCAGASRCWRSTAAICTARWRRRSKVFRCASPPRSRRWWRWTSAPVDRARPDGRDLITTEPPTYALHRWDGTNLVTHYERISDWRVLAHYTDAHQAMIRDMMAERE